MLDRYARGVLAASLVATITTIAPHALAAQGVKETVHLVITGGKNAGTYDASTTEGGCSAGLTGPNSFGNQLSDAKGAPNKFNSLQLIVPDAKAAASGTKQFLITISFGPLMHRTAEYEVNTQPNASKPSGSGTVTIQDHGSTAKVLFDVQTADGVKLNGTIDCKSVLRAGS